MERKSSKIDKKDVQRPPTLEEAQNMLAFADSQIEKLKATGSEDKRLLEYLNQKRDKAIKAIARIEGESKK
ncbi:hypothetical protein A2917_00720 [Candidatus Nomurabacteria bacterium RIFCSPLOWO2_01_FULL_42_17]|uniref:50S ribosomal protein L29 n=1 Tax=Candidatus Nomurabacteria bacterium RIFCSPLOWO2_01_FULL_42_17 TaxID=1801780 RepID=A0A1F6XM56_9BACT|nr:MAG: hypothetical protein A2917_00720 [Candidatus Nomurabacteria bacterium RIFCSPLOWO2_01_FULL_42_17]